MDLYIYNQSFENIGIVDTATSIIWHRKFFEAGNFQIDVPATDNYLALLKTDYFVAKENSVECGIITAIKIAKNEDGKECITATGMFLSSLFYNRVIDKTKYNTQTELIMRDLVDRFAITPVNKKIPYLELGTLNGFTETFECYTNYEKMQDYLSALAKVSNIGFRVRFDSENLKLIFETYQGTDRSINQTVNPQVIFSQEYDNLSACEYTKDTTTEINVVIARYSGTMGEVTVEVGTATGFERKEKYIEGDCVTETKYVLDTEGNPQSIEVINVAETEKALTALAEQSLIDEVENFEGEVDFEQGYKIDYDLGDIITIVNDRWGKNVSTRIYEVQEVYDENGIKVIPVFGVPSPTLSDILKRS